MKRRPRNSSYSYDRDRDDDFAPLEDKPSKAKSPSLFNYTSLAIIAGIFILGIGVGVGFSSTVSSSPNAIVSNVQIDQQSPNPEICIQNGASAIALETRFFVTLNPFKVYVAQASTQPGCVLRSANWAVLEQRKLISADQTRECRQRMNTFGYTGTLENNPKIDCLYQSENAKNLFLTTPGAGAVPPGEEKF